MWTVTTAEVEAAKLKNEITVGPLGLTVIITEARRVC